MTLKAVGLKFRFGLNLVGLGSEGLYTDLVKDHQDEINQIGLLPAELTAELALNKSAVARIWGEVQAKANKKDFQGAADQFNDQLLPLLAPTLSGAEKQRRAKLKYEGDLAGAELKVKTLKDHKHKAAISVEFGKIDGYLTSAKNFAKAPTYEFASANGQIEKIDTEYPDAKYHADRTEAFRNAIPGLQKRIDNLKVHQGKDGITVGEFNGLDTKLALVGTHVTNRAWTDALNAYKAFNTAVDNLLLKAHEWGNYIGLVANSNLLVKALEEHPYTAQITAEITEIKDDHIAKAQNEYVSLNHPNKANNLLNAIPAKYNTAKTKADNHGKSLYETPRDDITPLLSALESPVERAAFVTDQIAEIKALMAKAAKYATATQYAPAIALVAEAKKVCEAAKKIADEQTQLAADEKDAKDAAAQTGTNAPLAIAAARKLWTALDKHPGKAGITEALEAIKKDIDDAEKLAT